MIHQKVFCVSVHFHKDSSVRVTVRTCGACGNAGAHKFKSHCTNSLDFGRILVYNVSGTEQGGKTKTWNAACARKEGVKT